MDAATVAHMGYKAMNKGKSLVIAGLINAVLVFSIRLAPRAITPKIVRALHSRQ